MSKTIVFLCSLMLLYSGRAPSLQTNWDSIPDHAREIIQAEIPPADHLMSEDESQRFVSSRGTRGGTYDLVGMLLRGTENDLKNGEILLREILSRQNTDESDPRLGIWHPGREGRPLDANWREFVGMGMILIKECFSERVTRDLHGPLDESILYAAKGAMERKVSPEYTNIALMSAFVMAYAGAEFKEKNILQEGMMKGEAVWEEFAKHGTFAEFNSPTYYGVDLMALAFWREWAPKRAMRQWGRDMEAGLWRDIAAFYHADLKNLAGPYSRGYGMDMAEYHSITGLLMDLVLGDPELSPSPKGGQGRSSFERYYLPLFVIVPTAIPDDALLHLKTFQGPRVMGRTVPRKGGDYQITAAMEPSWMMGAAKGMRRRWEQHCPATLHWRVGEDELGWLLVKGESGVDAVASKDGLKISLPDIKQSYQLTIHISAPGLAADQIGEKTWVLPSMSLLIESQIGQPETEWIESKRMGQVLQLRWDIGKNSVQAEGCLEVIPVAERPE